MIAGAFMAAAMFLGPAAAVMLWHHKADQRQRRANAPTDVLTVLTGDLACAERIAATPGVPKRVRARAVRDAQTLRAALTAIADANARTQEPEPF